MLLDLRLRTFGLEDGSGFEEGFRSESIEEEVEVVLVGEEAEGCGVCDWDAVVVGMRNGFDVDIATRFVRCSVHSDVWLLWRVTVEDSMLRGRAWKWWSSWWKTFLTPVGPEEEAWDCGASASEASLTICDPTIFYSH